MSNIFLSYDGRDLDRVKVLAATLESQGWTVFLDRTIPPGKTWQQFIGKEIDECRCMVVAWSTHSVNSTWVKVEANIGLKHKILVPLLLDQITPPLEFGSIQAANLVGWQGETDSSGYLDICNALTELLGPGIPSAASAFNNLPHRPSNVIKPKICWFEQLTVKAGKITAITATLAIMLWYEVPVSFSQKEATIPGQAPSADYKVIHQPMIKEPEMLRIPAGSFQMGSNDDSEDEKPVHPVRIKSFSIGRYEVTFDEYYQFAEALGKPKPEDNGWGRGKRPVINVSYDDAVAYVQWLSSETGKHFRLPSEAEWEYAARAGTTGDYYWDGQGEAKNFAWFDSNSKGKTHPVGEKKPNVFGLHDMAGNVWEWVQDCWHDNYDQAPADGSPWQAQNNGDCARRVLRGGSWNYTVWIQRSANRFWYYPVYHYGLIGFRLAQD